MKGVNDSVYGYQTYRHYHDNKSLYIHPPKPELSTAENILRMLRPNKKYTQLEAEIIDIALILHAGHGVQTMKGKVDEIIQLLPAQ